MTKNTHSPTPGEAFRSDLHERLPKRSARAGIIDQKIDGAELLADALESCRYLDRTAGINSVAPGYHTKPIVLTASVDWQSTRHSHRQLKAMLRNAAKNRPEVFGGMGNAFRYADPRKS